MAQEQGRPKFVTVKQLVGAMETILGDLEKVRGIPDEEVKKIRAMTTACQGLLKEHRETQHDIGNLLHNRKDRPEEEQPLWDHRPEGGVFGTRTVAC